MTMNMPSAIETKGLVKVFRDFWRRPKVRAVDGLDLTVQSGEIFGLLGPNGSGKSTAIKMLLGLLHPSGGTIQALGRSPRDVAVKRRIGYVPEESSLYPYLTPVETLNFYGKLFDLNAAARRERTGQLLEMVGLAHVARRPVGEFSKGMARRIALAQALINDPQLIVLDEPTSGLDPIGCRQVKDLMSILAQRGKTILLCSHLLADVEDVCDRVAILYSGRIRAQGPVKTLLEKRDHVSLTLPSLPPDVMNRVLGAVREIAAAEPEVRCPTMNLEQFFLEVVAEAHRATPYGTGVSHTVKLADYLTRASAQGEGSG